MKLYEISDKYNQLIAYMEDAEDPNELKDTLDAIEDAFDSKVESIAKLIRAKKAEKEAIEDEIRRLRARADKINKETEWLENYVKTEMENVGRERVKSAIFNISLRLNPPSVRIIDDSSLPEWAISEKVMRTVDKRSILERLKNGEKIPGVELVQNKHLRIS